MGKTQNKINFFFFIFILLKISLIIKTNESFRSLEEDSKDFYPFKFEIVPKETFDRTSMIEDDGYSYFDEKITAQTIIEEMGIGWNLGNTLEAYDGVSQNQGLDSETSWGVPETNEEMIEGLIEKGFKSIRIPITWSNHIIDQGYTIDPKWMKRVKTIVDWCIEKGLYVIINTFHDVAFESGIDYGKGYYLAKNDKAESERFLYNIWEQIAEAFNNGYDHHLIFECLSEPRLIGSDYEREYKRGEGSCEAAVSCLNEYLRLIVKTIRDTGGNNEKRFIMVTPYAAEYKNLINSDFIFPGDSKYNPGNPKILLSLHIYEPYLLVMNEDVSKYKFKESYKDKVYNIFQDLYERFILKGHYVVISETGIINKNNTEERIKWGEYFVENSRKFQMCCFLWDNMFFDNSESPSEVFGNYHRDKLKWEDEDFIDTLITSSQKEFSENIKTIYTASLITSSKDFVDQESSYYVDPKAFNIFNTYSSLTIEAIVEEDDDEEEEGEENILTVSIGTSTKKLVLTEDDVEGGEIKVNKNGGIILNKEKEKHVIDIYFTKENILKIKDKGLTIRGKKFSLSDLYVSGPRITKISPTQIEKSSKKQSIKIYFTEEAKKIEDSLILVSPFNRIKSKSLTCTEEKDILTCEGVFDFTGDYEIQDENGFLFGNRILSVVPEDGKSFDITNLIDTKINFDDNSSLETVVINLSKDSFKNVDKNSVLNIEINDLFFTTSYRILFIYKLSNNKVVYFNEEETNVEVSGDGGFSVPAGKQVLQIYLSEKYNTFKESGISIKGYGFSISTIFITEAPEEEEE